MQIGFFVPSFAPSVEPALEAASRAEEVGLHGVFCYDHIWPMGHPGQPAIAPYPLLAAIARSTERLALGTLVARVGLEPDGVLVAKLETIAALAPGRTIAGLGTGDHHSEDENHAFGIEHRSADERRASLVDVATSLSGSALEVWVGGGSARTNAVARELGCTLNLWDVPVATVLEEAQRGPVSWGGPLGRSPDVAAEKLVGLAAAGATWAVFASRRGIDPVLEAVRRAGLELAR